MNKLILIVGMTIIFLAVVLTRQDTKVPIPEELTVNTEENTDHNATSTPNISNNRTVDLSNQGLESIPSYVFNETGTEKLDVSNNNLTGAIQSQIGQLKNLKILDVSNNSMTGVPAEVGQLEKLEILNLSNNTLTGLPNELGNLKNLKVLDLSGNDYSEQDLSGIRNNLPSTVDIILN